MKKKLKILLLVLIFFGLPPLALAQAKIDVQVTEREKEVILNWEPVPGVFFYKVFRNSKDISTKDHQHLPAETVSFSDKTAEPGQKYEYVVAAYRQDSSTPMAKSGPVQAELKTAQAGQAPSSTPEGEVKVGAPFPGEPEKVDLVTHIMYVHKWAAGIGSLLAVLMIIFAGFKYMTSSGNPEALGDAKETIIGALAGLSIIILTYFLLEILQARLGAPPTEAPPPEAGVSP